jgi:hypothetical protein
MQPSSKLQRRCGTSCHRGHHHPQALLQQAIESARWFLCCTFRHQSAGETRLLRAQCRLGERKMDEIALGEATATAMRDAAHACQPFVARRIVTAGEGKQRFAERRRQRILGKRQREPLASVSGSASNTLAAAAVRPAAANAIMACTT